MTTSLDSSLSIRCCFCSYPNVLAAPFRCTIRRSLSLPIVDSENTLSLFLVALLGIVVLQAVFD